MKEFSITLRWVEGYPITHWVVGLLTTNPGTCPAEAGLDNCFSLPFGGKAANYRTGPSYLLGPQGVEGV
jgi:hypothetical protein